MICVFPSDATDFASNGLCVLTPTACSVTETLNGEWELSMTHPLDDRDKWTYLQVGCIIRAPVPAAMTPRVALVQQTSGWSVYTITTKSGKLNLRSGPGTSYRRLGQYAKGKEVVLISKTNDSWYEVTAPDGKRGYRGDCAGTGCAIYKYAYLAAGRAMPHQCSCGISRSERCF